jgi:hypothetical protein
MAATKTITLLRSDTGATILVIPFNRRQQLTRSVCHVFDEKAFGHSPIS